MTDITNSIDIRHLKHYSLYTTQSMIMSILKVGVTKS